MSEDDFGCHNQGWRGRLLLESNGNNPGMLLNAQDSPQPTHSPKEFPAQNVNSDEVEKPRHTEWVCSVIQIEIIVILIVDFSSLKKILGVSSVLLYYVSLYLVCVFFLSLSLCGLFSFACL